MRLGLVLCALAARALGAPAAKPSAALAPDGAPHVATDDDVKHVREVLSHFERKVGEAPRLSPEARGATMHAISDLQQLTRAITGEDADAAVAAVRREEKAKEEREAAAVAKGTSVLGQLGAELSRGFRDLRTKTWRSVYGEDRNFALAREQVADDARRILPEKFSQWARWTLTHPELRREILDEADDGRGAGTDLPEWIDSRTFRATVAPKRGPRDAAGSARPRRPASQTTRQSQASGPRTARQRQY